MLDALGRNIRYLRISVTDRCNLRCRYWYAGGRCGVGGPQRHPHL